MKRADLLFLIGLAGLIYETVFETVDRPELLIMFGAMMGVSVIQRINGK